MNIKYDPRMKRMKISHIMREYNITKEEAISLRSGISIKDTPKPKVVKPTKPSSKESF